MWDDAESALCCLAVRSLGHCAEKLVLCDMLRIVFVLARGHFMGRLEGSTLSI